jgi:hypothetical protein
MERLGLVAPGSLVLADNVLVPGAPDYLAHVGADATAASTGQGLVAAAALDLASLQGAAAAEADVAGLQWGAESGSEARTASEGSGSAAVYRTRLVGTLFEVEQRYKRDWQPRQDAMAVSLCVAAA